VRAKAFVRQFCLVAAAAMLGPVVYTTAPVAAAPVPAEVAAATSETIVIDDFNGDQLNTRTWTALTDRHNDVCVNARNASVGGGYLRLRAHQGSTDECPYVGARLSSKGKRTVGHGVTGARIDFNTRQGSWQPFVLFGTCPDGVKLLRCGEVDVAEVTRGVVHARLWSVRRDDPDTRCGIKADKPFQGLGQFHRYAVNLQPTFAAFLIDGQRWATITKRQVLANGCTYPFDDEGRRFTIRIGNTAGGWGGTPNPDAYPVTMFVDSIWHIPS